MTTRIHGLTKAHINRLVEQIKAVESMPIDQLRTDTEALGYEIRSNVQTEVVGEDTATVPDQITPEDELSKRMQRELALYQMIIDELDKTTIKLTHDTFLRKKLDAYKDTLTKAHDECYEILFCINILK